MEEAWSTVTQIRNAAYVLNTSLLSSLPNTSSDTTSYLAEAQSHLTSIEDILNNLTVHLVPGDISAPPDLNAPVIQATQHLTNLQTLTNYIPPHLYPDEDTQLPQVPLAGDKQPLSNSRQEILPKRTRRNLPAPLTLESAFTQHE